MQTIIRRIILVLLVIAAGYSIFGIVHFKWMYYRLDNPKAQFQITGDQDADTTVVEFISYGCGYCKQLHPTIQELLEKRKDIRYVARPIVFQTEESKQKADRLTRLALAAGLQNRFWEMHAAFLEYPELEAPEDFIKETAQLYGIDYEQLIKEANGKEVQKLLDNNMAALNHAGIYSVPSFTIKKNVYVVTNENLPSLTQLLDMIKMSE